MPWIVTTSATPEKATAATGIVEWDGSEDGATWVVPARGIATATVAALRAAGHTARTREQPSDAAVGILDQLAAIGEARARKNAAVEDLRAVLVETDEAGLMRAARAAGLADAEIARALCCDRQHIYATIGKGGTRGRVGMTG